MTRPTPRRAQDSALPHDGNRSSDQGIRTASAAERVRKQPSERAGERCILERVDAIRTIEQIQAEVQSSARQVQRIIKRQQARLEHNRRFLDSLGKAD